MKNISPIFCLKQFEKFIIKFIIKTKKIKLCILFIHYGLDQ